MDRRPYVLGGVLVVMAAVTAAILVDVLGTIFLALTVAYLLSPLRRRLRSRGASRLVATVLTTVIAVGGLLVVFSPLGYLLFIRFSDLVGFVTELPESVVIEAAGFSYELVVADLFDIAVSELGEVAASIAAALPVLLLQVALFVLLVFSVLYNEHNIRTAVFAVVPPAYRDIAESLHKRARETLYALYVVQAATGVATFLLALPVLLLLGYSAPIVLATVAGILQFVPVLGPSVLIIALVGSALIGGDIASALVIGVIGGIFIVAIPDVVIRPRLASRRAQLDSGLYFIGFVGGLLSLGAIGIIVGPLVVALLVEAAGLLAAEFPAEQPADPAADPPDTPRETGSLWPTAAEESAANETASAAEESDETAATAADDAESK